MKGKSTLVHWYLIAGLTIMAAGIAHAGDIPAKDVPSKVMDSFKKENPNATASKYMKETTDGKTTYEIEAQEGTQRRDYTYSKDGKLIQTEEGIATNELPMLVQTAVKEKYPKGEITKAERVNKGTMTQYEVTVKENGKSKEVELDSNGKFVKHHS